MFPPEQAQQLQMVDDFFSPHHSWIVTAAAASHYTYNHAFKVSCNLSHSPLLPSYHWLDFLPYVPAQKKKNVYIVRELITCCCHLLSCHSAAARSADISLLEMDSLQLRGKVNDCELNIERVFSISQAHMWTTQRLLNECLGAGNIHNLCTAYCR